MRVNKYLALCGLGSRRHVESLVTAGELVMLTPQICWYKDVYARVCDVVKAHFAEHETITLGELRDLLNSSRKYTLAVLGYYDKNRITKKDGDLVGQMVSEGTTPRQLTDLIGSLCDLTSGSGDKGTPIIYIQGYFDNYTTE